MRRERLGSPHGEEEDSGVLGPPVTEEDLARILPDVELLGEARPIEVSHEGEGDRPEQDIIRGIGGSVSPHQGYFVPYPEL